MMRKKDTASRFFNTTTLIIAGVVLLLFTAAAFLWYGHANSMQAAPALVAQVYFDGEYRIADGQWKNIEPGKHIPSTKGDVTLRGNFHLATPDGEYIGLYTDSVPIALYTDHINLTFYGGGDRSCPLGK